MVAELYAAASLLVNFFQHVFKLAEKRSDRAKVHRCYHTPATPFQRLMDDPRTSEQTCERRRNLAASLDPVRLLRDIRTRSRNWCS